ncbi:hypothetical protein LC612_31375 [Nostoc sp. CHAB 5834]|nr:hypothetical protein [Nostoc sp. CHAB 5834]
MHNAEIYGEELITKVTNIFKRENGSEAKVVVEAMFGAGLHRSVDTQVFRREGPDAQWHLCCKEPAPGWVSVDHYVKHGRPEMLKYVTWGEILKTSALIGKPMSALH